MLMCVRTGTVCAGDGYRVSAKYIPECRRAHKLYGQHHIPETQHFYPPREQPGLGNQFTYAGVLRRYFFLWEGSCPAIELAVA